MNKKVVLFCLAASVASIASAACCIGGCSFRHEGKRPLKIALNIWTGYSHVFIAQEKGFFKKNKVDVEFFFTKEYSKAQELYVNGEVDGVFEVFPDTIMHNARGIFDKVVYITDISYDADVIIGKPGLRSLADLKGKRIGIDGINTFSHLFVLKSLELCAGLKESDVFFENVPGQDAVSFLESGAIDAAHTWDPAKTEALKKGYKVLARAGDVKGIITDVLCFSAAVVESRPREIEAVVKSLLEARDFLYTKRQEGVKIIARAENMTEYDIENALSGIKQPDLEENIRLMSGAKDAGTLYRIGENIISFYANMGQISEVPVLEQILEPKFLKNIKGK